MLLSVFIGRCFTNFAPFESKFFFFCPLIIKLPESLLTRLTATKMDSSVKRVCFAASSSTITSEVAAGSLLSTFSTLILEAESFSLVPFDIIKNDVNENSDDEIPPRATANINSISDKELFTIFNILPMEDLMRVELVCTRWRWIQGLVCGSKCRLILSSRAMYMKENFIKISRFWYFTDYNSVVPIEERSLRVDHLGDQLSNKTVDYLVEKFPKVTKFALYHVSISVEQFHTFGRNWRHLESLFIFGSEKLITELNCDHFYLRLERLRRMKHLALPFDMNLGQMMQNLWNVMPRLDSLYLSGNFKQNQPIPQERQAEMDAAKEAKQSPSKDGKVYDEYHLDHTVVVQDFDTMGDLVFQTNYLGKFI